MEKNVDGRASNGPRSHNGMAAGGPLDSAVTFLGLVTSGPAASTHLLNLVTPESAAAWGNFEAVRGRLNEIGNWGLGIYPVADDAAVDVAYVKILPDVAEAYELHTDALISVAALITLVWRPEAGSWLVHSFGGFLPAAYVPRTSPNVAPSYTRGPD